MIKNTGYNQSGIPSVNRPHLGDLLLSKYKSRMLVGFDDLERFDLIDRLEKPVLNFGFYGTKSTIIEVYDFMSRFPYSFFIRTNKGLDIWNLPERGTRHAEVYISRFPNLIKFIRDNEDTISNDLWGLLYGYPLPEIHQFTYDWDTWKKKRSTRRKK